MIAEFDISFLTRVGSHNCYRLHENGLSHQVECCCFINLIGESFPSLLVSADFDTPDTDGAIIDNSKAATAIANVVYFPMLFLSGATIPIETMPDTVQSIAKFIPLTHAVEMMKGAWAGKSLLNFGTQILVLLAIIVVCITVSILSFRWDSDNV